MRTAYGYTIRETVHKQDNRVYCFLDDEVKEALDRVVKDHRTRKSQVLRTALIRYLRDIGYDPNK
jgi:hypothetical protein